MDIKRVKLKENLIGDSAFYRRVITIVLPIIMKIVFTKTEVQEESGVSEGVVSKIINQLVDLGILIPDNTVRKKGYRYQQIYEVFVGQKEYM